MASSHPQGPAPLPEAGAGLDDRLAEAAEGEFVSAAAIEEWVASWFTPDELPPPDADLRFPA